MHAGKSWHRAPFKDQGQLLSSSCQMAVMWRTVDAGDVGEDAAAQRAVAHDDLPVDVQLCGCLPAQAENAPATLNLNACWRLNPAVHFSVQQQLSLAPCRQHNTA